MRCNEKIKFAALLEKALELGFDAVCTGHYATIVDGAAGTASCTARARGRRTSPTCSACSRPSSSRTRTSRSATTPSKALVRAEAAARGLTVAQKPDSHDICFIPDGDTRGWLAEQRRRGDGRHRRPLGRRRRLARGRARVHRRPAPRTVARQSRARWRAAVRARGAAESNTVVVGPKEALATAEIAGARYTWAGPRRADAATPFACDVQIRAHADPVPAAARRRRRRARRSPRGIRSTAWPPARPPCSTSARACSDSSRSTAPSARCPHRPEPASARPAFARCPSAPGLSRPRRVAPSSRRFSVAPPLPAQPEHEEDHP